MICVGAAGEIDRREVRMAECSCCGCDRVTVALAEREDVRLCRDCVGWLAGKVGVVCTPTLSVLDLRDVIDFYERAGFGVRVYKEDEDDPGDGFAFVNYDGQSVFDLDVVDIDPARNRAGCYLIVQDADGWHARMAADGRPVPALADHPCVPPELALTGPAANTTRLAHQ